ncbi:MAG: hypothetical protein FJ297_13070 [Planctomycetes bacterium]|nr:hypothetical protein [Planctomycetota bacterium]
MRKRQRHWIDGNVQAAIVWRVAMYWVHCLITVAFMTVIWMILTDTPRNSTDLFRRLTAQCGPAFGASLLLLPLVVIDAVRMSNRFVGPMYRLRRAMRALAEGEPVPDQTFRQNDFWHEMADDFNRVARRVRQFEDDASAKPHGVFTKEDDEQLAASIG